MPNPSRYGAIKENVVPDLMLPFAENMQSIPLITPLNQPIPCRQSITLGKPTNKVVFLECFQANLHQSTSSNFILIASQVDLQENTTEFEENHITVACLLRSNWKHLY